MRPRRSPRSTRRAPPSRSRSPRLAAQPRRGRSRPGATRPGCASSSRSASAAIDERRSGLAARLAEVEARLAARPDEEARARARRAQLEHKRDAVDALAARLVERAARREQLADRLRRRRQEQSEAARAAGRKLDGLRAERAEAEQQLAELRERVGRLEIEEAEIRLRLEQAIENVRREFDCEPDVAIAAPLPEIPDGTTLSARARELERELRLMGPINPLALSEYEALVERHEFLQQQLDDVRNTRRELARVIKAVDEEIVNVFESAFADVARHFSELFAMLFPGGSGRVVLTDPARPAQHRHRDGGAAVGQDRAPAVAAVGW